MIVKARKTTATSLKKSLHDIRKSLSQSIPNFEAKSGIPLEFSRIGTRYQIERAPVPPNDKIGVQLEKSFNEFMKKLKIEYKGVKLEGTALIGTTEDMFLISYNNLELNGDQLIKQSKAIHGELP